MDVSVFLFWLHGFDDEAKFLCIGKRHGVVLKLQRVNGIPFFLNIQDDGEGFPVE